MICTSKAEIDATLQVMEHNNGLCGPTTDTVHGEMFSNKVPSLVGSDPCHVLQPPCVHVLFSFLKHFSPRAPRQCRTTKPSHAISASPQAVCSAGQTLFLNSFILAPTPNTPTNVHGQHCADLQYPYSTHLVVLCASFTEMSLGLGTGTTFMTNEQILEVMHPQNPAVPFVYEKFATWGTSSSNDWDPFLDAS